MTQSIYMGIKIKILINFKLVMHKWINCLGPEKKNENLNLGIY